MRWQAERPAGPGSIGYSGEISSKSWTAVSKLIVEFVRKLFQAIAEKYESKRWDVVQIEQWADSGRLIGFPIEKGEAHSKKRVAVQISMDLLENSVEALPDPECFPARFEAGFKKLEKNVWKMVKEAFGTEEVKEAIVAAHPDGNVQVIAQSADDEDSAFLIHGKPTTRSKREATSCRLSRHHEIIIAKKTWPAVGAGLVAAWKELAEGIQECCLPNEWDSICCRLEIVMDHLPASSFHAQES